MTAQPTLFDTGPDSQPAAGPVQTVRCWWCKKRTPHDTLTTYPNGTRMVRCTICNAGSNLR